MEQKATDKEANLYVELRIGQRSWRPVWIAAIVLMIASHLESSPACGQTLSSDPLVQANFSGITEIGTEIGPIGQMTFGPDGKLYVATFGAGVKRYDYDPSGNLSNGVTVWSRAEFDNQVNGSLGIAFHEDPTLGTVMYLAPAVTGGFNPEINITQSILRLTDNDADGNWGEAGEVNQAIVDNLRVTDLHQVNQMVVRDDALYLGIGSRTRTGGRISEYGGAPNPDDGEFAYTGAINWIRDLTQLSGDTATSNLAGFSIADHHNDTQGFTSADTGKLTVYSTGFRNVYGLAFDGEGELWATMNQNEDPLLPDELHQSDFQDDHQFPKKNEVSGDWKTNATAIAEGFFQTFKDPVALLGNHASADGLTFSDINNVFAGRPFIVRYAQGKDLISVDPETGTVLPIATGFFNPLDVTTDPNGQLLVGTHGGGGSIFRVGLIERSGILGDFNESSAIDEVDWGILKNHFNLMLEGTVGEAYAMGDMNADFAVNHLDFALFKLAYEDFHGMGSFDGLDNATVPEPPGLALAALAICGLTLRAGRFRGRFPITTAQHDLALS